MTYSKGTWNYDAESGIVTTDDRTGDWTKNPIGQTVICSVEPLDGVRNGHLIAEALAMLEALKKALRDSRGAMTSADRYDFDNEFSGPEWMFIAREIIERVEGRS